MAQAPQFRTGSGSRVAAGLARSGGRAAGSRHHAHLERHDARRNRGRYGGAFEHDRVSIPVRARETSRAAEALRKTGQVGGSMNTDDREFEEFLRGFEPQRPKALPAIQAPRAEWRRWAAAA